MKRPAVQVALFCHQHNNNNKITSSDLPLPNLAQAANQPPVSTVYSSQLCAVMGACIVSHRLASVAGGRASLPTCSSSIGRLTCVQQNSPATASAARLAAQASVDPRPSMPASVCERTLACSGLIVPTVQTGGCVLQVLFLSLVACRFDK
jgi:hypothetical protein